MSNSDYATGLPEKGVYGDLSQLTPGQLVTYALQEHRTKRSKGRAHYDLRLGTPDTGLFSWAVPKARMPLSKEKLLAIRTELHRYGYGKFQGQLGPGYGAGQVRRVNYGDANIDSQTPRSIQFTPAGSDVPTQYHLIHTKDDKWLLSNTTPQEPEEKQAGSIPWLFSKPDVVVPGTGPHTLIAGLSGSGKTTDMRSISDGKKQIEVDDFFPLSTDEGVDDNDLAWHQTLQFEPKLEKMLKKKQPSIIEGVQLPIFRKVPGAMDQTWRIKRTSLIKSTLRKWLRDRKHTDDRYSLSLLQSLKGNLATKKNAG